MDGYETGRRCAWLQSSIRHQARAREKDSCGEDRRRLAVRSRERRGLRTADARVVAGEALGLKWSDIDLNIGTLRVNQQVQRIRDDGVLVSSEPKNSSRHTMDLPQRAAEALSRSHCKRQAEEKARRDALGGLELVLATTKGTTWMPRTSSTATSSRGLNAPVYPPIRWHDLRH